MRTLAWSIGLGVIGLSLVLLIPAEPATGNQDDGVLWSLGEQDGLSIEFAPGGRDEATYIVGESDPTDDFPGYHEGAESEGSGQVVRKPYTIAFDLEEEPEGSYELVLDLIYQTGAPQQIEVEINGKRGIFPVRRRPAQDRNSSQANSMLLAKQQLVVPVEGAWLDEQENTVTIVPLGVGSMSYDALSFRAGETSKAAVQPQLTPTVLYRERGGNLVEVAKLRIPFRKRFEQGAATITLGDRELQSSFTGDGYDFGVLTRRVEVPALEEETRARVQVNLDDVSMQAAHAFTPAKKWKFYVAPKIHNDVGYTDLQPHVNELDTRNTDRVLEVLDRYPFYVFNFETSWLVDNYLDHRTQPYREEFLQRAAEGRAPINAFYLNLLTGLASGEELYRATYFTHELHREHGSNFNWASLTDAPSHTWFLPTLFSDIGVDGFSVGSNQTRAPILRFSDLNEDSPFYWEGMNGEQILMWYARSYIQLKRLAGLGGWSSESDLGYMEASVPQFLTRYQREDYAPDAVMIYGAYVDNAAIPKTGDAPIIQAWNEEYAYPKLIVASDDDFFEYIDSEFKDDLPVYRGGAGAYWEDGAASTAKATKLNQNTQEVLPMAETVASLSSLLMPRYTYPAEAFEKAWKNVMFYDEHTWGAFNSISQPDREFVERQWEVKESYATRANLDARTLLTRSMNRLSQLFEVGGDTFFAFNWQPWQRTAPMEVELNAGQYLVDLASGEPVEYDVLASKDGYRRIRFMAKGVPPMGYKGYAVRSLEEPPDAAQQAKDVSGREAESPHYRLEVDQETGGLASLYDKEAGKELVDEQASYALNEYLYVTGGQDSKVLNHGMGLPPADLQIHEPASVEIVENVTTPIGQRVVVETRSVNTPTIRSEYRLYSGLKRVDIINTVVKEPTRAKEGVYFAFPFAAEEPSLAYQIQNGWLRPNRDQLPGAAREWFTTQNLVHVQDGDFSVAWSTRDAPLITLTDINRGEWPRHLDLSNGHVFSYAMNNYWFTNYRASQGGEFTFRYSITSGEDMDHVALARFDADTRKPVLEYPYLSSFSAGVESEGRPLSADKGSFFDVSAPSLQFVVLKKAEDGQGYILRLRETAGQEGEAVVELPLFDVQEAYLANGVEVNQRALPVSGSSVEVPYGPNSYVTVRLLAEPAL